eukprot:Amastigsp_a683_8.p3 type:complete len:275 gc:universal Amastigsp_a683_8:2603-1779(-)
MGMPTTTQKRIAQMYDEFAARRYVVNLVMPSKVTRPCSTAATIELKSSLRRTTSAALIVRSVPAIPIAMPTLACLMAGASLTPSPVMAAMCPRALNAITRASLFAGDTRAKHDGSLGSATRSSCESWSSSTPVMTAAPAVSLESIIPSWLAMALAVAGWSPVIMTTWMPAVLATRIESKTVARGGSRSAMRPSKQRSRSTTSGSSGRLRSACAVMSRCARPRTRSPFEDIAMISRSALLTSSAVMARSPCSSRMRPHNGSMRSAAPLVAMYPSA